jgi:hypothetical protein
MTEHGGLERKTTLDLAIGASKVKFVAEIVAMANADGGVVRIGVTDDGEEVGVAPDVARRLDPAAIANLLDSFTAPDHVEVTVSTTTASAGQIVDLLVEQFADPPLVMCKDGNYDDDGQQRFAFRKGDVLVRRGTRAQRATRGDYSLWTRQACDNARQTLLERVAFVAELPPEAQLQVTVAGADMTEPAGMLNHAVQAWRQDQRRLLGPTELAWLLSGEASLGQMENDSARLLVHSALRKKSTLWHWIARIQPSADWVERVILETLAGSDRDVSDAGRPIVDLASVYLDDERYGQVLHQLAASRHQHSRDAASSSPDRSDQVERLRTLAARPLDGIDLATLDDDDLRARSHQAASRLLSGQDQATSNRLSRYGLESFRRGPQGLPLT